MLDKPINKTNQNWTRSFFSEIHECHKWYAFMQLIFKISDGSLTFKDSYQYHSNVGLNISWAKSLWNISIPPSKFVMVWRSLHNKLPTYENFSARGCQLPLTCSICRNNQETTIHLLLECTFAKLIWQWLSLILKLQCNFATIQEAIQISHRKWSHLCKIVILSDVINSLNTIWFFRNQMRFADKMINFMSAINLIRSGTAMTGNNPKCAANSSIADFVLLKAFSVKINYGNVCKIKEVIWQPPSFNCFKCRWSIN